MVDSNNMSNKEPKPLNSALDDNIILRKKDSGKTLNLHLTDHCNFKCTHCFVNRRGKELSFDQCKQVIDKVVATTEYSRINLAGGEPLLVKHIQELIDYIVEKRLECSIITNGSHLTEAFINHNRNKLAMIGISVDSLDDEINQRIGRKTLRNLEELCRKIKDAGIKLKINVCVSQLNLHCNFEEMLERTKPDRFKLLQVLPSPHASCSKILISDQEFNDLCNRLKPYNPVCEDHEVLATAYWIIDSEGKFGKNNLHIDDNSREVVQ